MIRPRNDFSLPLNKLRLESQSVTSKEDVDRLTMHSKNMLTQKSYSKRSLNDKAVISGGVKRTKRQEERRVKMLKTANFDYLRK